MTSTPASRRMMPRVTPIVSGIPPRHRRDDPAEVGRAVPVGGREREPGDEGDGRADQPQPVEREAPADHGVRRSSARRCIVIAVRSVAMSTS